MARIANTVLCLSMFVLTLITGCQNNTPQSKNSLNVGAMAGPETRLLEVAKNVAKKTSGLSVNIIEYGDHHSLPSALAHGSVDVAFAQLSSTAKDVDPSFVSMGKFFLYPTSSYSRKIKNTKELHYADHILARLDNQTDPRIQQLITALHSADVTRVAGKLFNGQAVSGWEQGGES